MMTLSDTSIEISKPAGRSAVNEEFVITCGKRRIRLLGDFVAGTRVIRNVRPAELLHR